MNLFRSLTQPGMPQIDPQSVRDKLSTEPKPFVLDVREPDEYVEGHISGASLIPLGQLTARMGEIPRDREIICVCHSGSRSGAATRHLLASGLQAINMSGGMARWARSGLPMLTGKSQGQL
jgi:rhodanese-related sulfurtransferase